MTGGKFLSEVLHSPARCPSNSVGHDIEYRAEKILNSTKNHRNELIELYSLNKYPVYDLGCGIANGIANGIAIVFRTYMPDSKFIGVDIDYENYVIRKKILEKWEGRGSLAKEL